MVMKQQAVESILIYCKSKKETSMQPCNCQHGQLVKSDRGHLIFSNQFRLKDGL